MAISLTTLRKWLRRFRKSGLLGLRDRSSRPYQCSRRLLSAVRAQIIDLRLHWRTGGFIASRLAISGASVARVLHRACLSRWRKL